MKLFIYDRDGVHRHVFASYIHQPTTASYIQPTTSTPKDTTRQASPSLSTTRDPLLRNQDASSAAFFAASSPTVVYHPYTVHGYLYDKTKPRGKATKRPHRHWRNRTTTTTTAADGSRKTVLPPPVPPLIPTPTNLLQQGWGLVGVGVGVRENNDVKKNHHRDQFERRQQPHPQTPLEKHHLRYADNDKTDTLTWCRFDARTQYGYTTVLVVDYDEFLYCPRAKASFRAQVDDPPLGSPTIYALKNA